MTDEKQPDPSQLSALAEKTVEIKKISGQQPVTDWLRLFKELATFDDRVDAIQAKAKSRFILWLVLTIVFLFASAATMGIALVLFIPALVLTIRYHRAKKRWKEVDLDNEFKEVLIPLLQALQEDIGAKGQVTLGLDLAGPVESKIVKKGEIAPGRFKKVTATIIADPWCRMTAPLLDGGRLTLKLVNHYVSHERRWTSSRGKSKSKTKWKKVSVVTAGWQPDPDQYQIEQSQAADPGAKIKTGTKQKGAFARLTRKFKFSSLSDPPAAWIAVEDIMGMFFQLGSMLRPASTGGPKQ